jgi:hypothetical protein
MFAAALRNPVPPTVVAEKILDVAQGGTQQLRHLVGPDAATLVNWRRQMPDEEWLDINGADDNVFFTRLKQAFEPASQHETLEVEA